MNRKYSAGQRAGFLSLQNKRRLFLLLPEIGIVAGSSGTSPADSAAGADDRSAGTDDRSRTLPAGGSVSNSIDVSSVERNQPVVVEVAGTVSPGTAYGGGDPVGSAAGADDRSAGADKILQTPDLGKIPGTTVSQTDSSGIPAEAAGSVSPGTAHGGTGTDDSSGNPPAGSAVRNGIDASSPEKKQPAVAEAAGTNSSGSIKKSGETDTQASGSKNSYRRNLRRKRFLLLGITGGVIVLWLLIRAGMALLPFPQLDAFINRPCSTRMYDRTGQLLQVLPLDEGLRREWYNLSELPPRIGEVFIAAEDSNFYRHGGIDIAALIRAAYQNLSTGQVVSGASTITMQLARMVIPRKEGEPVTLGVKIAEAWTALRIESKLSKDRILELYLNSVPFGLQAEGIGSAARTFFGCTPAQLSDARIHLLAVLLRRPAAYNPFEHPDASYDAVLEFASRTGFSASKEEWLAEVSVTERYTYPLRVPHFINYIRDNFAGQEKNLPPEMHLSIDSALTEYIENEINTQIDLNQDARLSQGALLAIDNSTGEIVCWSGGNFFSENAGQIDGVTVRNQSGSTMKPFLYASALEQGFSPATVFADVPMDFGSEEVYVPLNFNNQYNGPVLMRTALASSLNIPAVYLLYRLGVDNFMETLYRLGFDSLQGERGRTGLSLALGSGEVTLLELTRAFSVFSRGGSVPELTWDAVSPDTAAPELGRVFQTDTASVICSMLSDRRARALGFGFAEVFHTPYPAIFKTGTSNQFQNIIALGSTTGYTVGVWMGNFTGETVIRETGSSIPAGIVRRLLDILAEQEPDSAEEFPEPVTYRKAPVCVTSGMAPGPFCNSVAEEYIPAASLQNRPVCTWHYSMNGRVQVRYPQEYQRWLGGRNAAGTMAAGSDSKPVIMYPVDGAVFVYDPGIPAESQKLRVDCTGAGDWASLFVNGTLFETLAPPFVWYVPLSPGTMRLEVYTENPDASTGITVTVK